MSAMPLALFHKRLMLTLMDVPPAASPWPFFWCSTVLSVVSGLPCVAVGEEMVQAKH